MSKIKKYSATVMVFMLALCVAYFSVMSPTSAWYYESGVIDSGDAFVFGDLSVNTKFTVKNPVYFDAATKLADEDEAMFDDVISIDSVEVKNSGTVPARVYVDFKENDGKDAVKWFVYTDDMLVNNSVKETIKANLTELSDEALMEYNVGKDGNSGKYILLQPNETIDVKVATWVEYDEVEEMIKGGTAENSYDVELTLIATQDIDGAIKR